MTDNNEMNNNEFFKETIIPPADENIQPKTEERTADKEVDVEVLDSSAYGIPKENSLIFSRDVDTDSQYIKELLLEKMKQKKKKYFLRYTAAVLCGMIAGAAIFGGAYTLGARSGNRNSVLQQYSVGNNQSGAETLNFATGKELSVTQINSKVGPSVVGIVSKQSVNTWFGVTEQEGNGSGIIVTSDGYVVTNSHVIEGANSFKVVLASSEEYEAKIVGQDAKTDLAVLKIEATGLPAAELGKSSELQVGELAVSIGNPLGLEFQGSVTAGVISALNRTMNVDGRQYTMLQTDAAINPGNSGGPLVNKFGQVIGINTVKISSSDTEGMGFAIPIDVAAPIVEELIQKGYVSGRPQIGINTTEISQNMSMYYNMPAGIYVIFVSPGSGAEKAGIAINDRIISADGKNVLTTDELNDIKDTHKVGETIELGIVRGGRTITVNVTLGEEKPTTNQ